MVDAQTIVFSGTSMSCPATTGCIALYLEKYPQTTFDQIRASLDSTTIRDAFVKLKGPVPNNYWGYGKLDIFKAMGGRWHTGIDEEELETMDGIIYPNPATGSIRFALPSQQEFSTIEVYDLSGRKVASEEATVQSIDVSSWNNGIYVYRISGPQQVLTGKLVIGH
jgi:hypothetical protein